MTQAVCVNCGNRKFFVHIEKLGSFEAFCSECGEQSVAKVRKESVQSLTPEQRAERSRHAGNARWAKHRARLAETSAIVESPVIDNSSGPVVPEFWTTPEGAKLVFQSNAIFDDIKWKPLK